MHLVSLIVKEIRFRKVNFALSLLAVVTAVSLFITFVTAGEAYRQETRRIQLGMGQNLRIIPKETPMDKFWLVGYSDYLMPEEYLYRFESLPGYDYTHLTGTLHKQIRWHDRDIILTGILPEVMPPGRRQPPMMFSVNRGDAYVGFEVARMFGIEAGDKIEILGRSFRVTRTLSPTGTNDDIRIYGHLRDVQDILGLEGRINEIRALECVCLSESGRTTLDPLTVAQRQLAEILPNAKVLLLQGIAEVRERQRSAMEGYLALLMPIILLACGAWIGVLAMMNVRQRHEEIGIMRALGYGSWKISVLILGRSVAIGFAGAILGFVVGTGLALSFGPAIFKTTAKGMNPEYAWLVWSIVLAPAFAFVSSLIPTAAAVTWDPAITLRNE
jgi:putative ABC transport system permease protein